MEQNRRFQKVEAPCRRAQPSHATKELILTACIWNLILSVTNLSLVQCPHHCCHRLLLMAFLNMPLITNMVLHSNCYKNSLKLVVFFPRGHVGNYIHPTCQQLSYFTRSKCLQNESIEINRMGSFLKKDRQKLHLKFLNNKKQTNKQHLDTCTLFISHICFFTFIQKYRIQQSFHPEYQLGNNYICFLAPRLISCLEPFDSPTEVGWIGSLEPKSTVQDAALLTLRPHNNPQRNSISGQSFFRLMHEINQFLVSMHRGSQ